MSASIFGLLLAGVLIVLARKASGGVAIAVVGLLLGVLIASSSGPIANAGREMNTQLRHGVATFAHQAFGG